MTSSNVNVACRAVAEYFDNSNNNVIENPRGLCVSVSHHNEIYLLAVCRQILVSVTHVMTQVDLNPFCRF